MKRHTKLLGNDFILCCAFSHVPGGSIVVSRVDLHAYAQKTSEIYKSAEKVVTQDEILELVSDSSKSGSNLDSAEDGFSQQLKDLKDILSN